MSKILLYHTGYQVIQNPDIYYGRKNADFGQGFYLTENPEFSKRWAREKKGTDTYVNVYELELHGLESSEIIKYREIVQKEEQDYQTLFAKCLERM